MIDLHDSSFFLPTTEFRKLSILLAIMRKPNLSQQVIARDSYLSGAMVNSYMKQLKEEKLVAIEDKNRRDKLYRLTEKGKRKLSQSLMTCSAEIVQLYVQAHNEIILTLQGHIDINKPCKVVLFGGADTARIVTNALENFPHVVLYAIIDNDKNKWGEKIGTHVIQPPDLLSKLTFDSLIISSFAKQEEIYQSVGWLEQKGVKIIKLTNLNDRNE